MTDPLLYRHKERRYGRGWTYRSFQSAYVRRTPHVQRAAIQAREGHEGNVLVLGRRGHAVCEEPEAYMQPRYR